ncbi:MAG: glutamine--fructose-6-phosphate transaminase (isomerizing) [Gammaproteobacteria bacterium]|nr:MAG: glutamine--fructose-6-phosphate transaminase (isomerizing) [Gammaproteobacteria bacterium]
MCGIVGAVADREVSGILLAGLQRLEYRGYDSAGVALLTDSGIGVRKTVGKVSELCEAIGNDPLAGKLGIAHTRWATHGAPSELNAHPHVSNDRIALAHNGIIENFEALREELIQAGYTFTSETDSEVIVHLVDRYYAEQGELLEAVRTAVKRLEGAYAIGVMAKDDPDRIIAARMGSPLVVGKGIGENFIASDALALRPVTDRFIYLEEGDLVEVRRTSVAIWNVADESVIRSTVRVVAGEDDVDRGNYRHFMQKEIHQQPKVLADTLEGRIGRARVLEQAFGAGAPEILDATRAVTIAACGTSYYAGLVAKYWIEELAGIPCHVEIASEFRYRKVAVIPDSLFVTLTQSGETADTLAALRTAKAIGYKHTLTICNVGTSTTVRESDLAMMLNAGTEVGVASTKAFTAMLADLLLLALLIGRRHGMAPELEAEAVAALHRLPDAVDAALALDDQVLRLSERFLEKHHALFLGRGPMYPIALEGALKLKEISYIHAEGYPAGELKHGPLALVDDDMPVIAVAPNDDLLEKLQSNLQEVRARGGELYVFADPASGFKDEDDVTVITLPEVDKLLAPIVYVVPLQLFAYHVAVLKGTDVDQPRNLAKSVTVE